MKYRENVRSVRTQTCKWQTGDTYLRFAQVENPGQVLALGAYHVMVLLERVLQLQQLVRTERGPNPLRLSEQRREEGRQSGRVYMGARELWVTAGLHRQQTSHRVACKGRQQIMRLSVIIDDRIEVITTKLIAN